MSTLEIKKKPLFDPEKIRRARAMRGLRATMLAAKVGITESAYTRIEQGKAQNPETMLKISKVLRVSMRSLMTDPE